jgi:hypothetical protein
MLGQISDATNRGEKSSFYPQVISSFPAKLDVIGTFGGSIHNSFIKSKNNTTPLNTDIE